MLINSIVHAERQSHVSGALVTSPLAFRAWNWTPEPLPHTPRFSTILPSALNSSAAFQGVRHTAADSPARLPSQLLPTVTALPSFCDPARLLSAHCSRSALDRCPYVTVISNPPTLYSQHNHKRDPFKKSDSDSSAPAASYLTEVKATILWVSFQWPRGSRWSVPSRSPSPATLPFSPLVSSLVLGNTKPTSELFLSLSLERSFPICAWLTLFLGLCT